MLSINEIKKQYPNNLQKFDRDLVREYLQYQILAIIFNHPIGNKLSFLGGTCLRLVYQSPRFSEDLDFDNKGLNYQEFEKLSQHIKKQLEQLGYIVEIKLISQKAFHCYIKFPEILFEQGLSPVSTEKILIQIDTFNQKVDYRTQIYILDKFDLFKQIIVTPKETILAQKLWTVTQRKRLKGRDFYDIMFLLQTTKPDLHFLKAKFNTRNIGQIKKAILINLSSANWKDIARDVEPFLTSKEDSEKIKLFPDFLKQVNWK